MNNMYCIGITNLYKQITPNEIFPIGTIPEGYRPSKNLNFRATVWFGTGTDWREQGYAIVYVTTDGIIRGSSNVKGTFMIDGSCVINA